MTKHDFDAQHAQTIQDWQLLSDAEIDEQQQYMYDEVQKRLIGRTWGPKQVKEVAVLHTGRIANCAGALVLNKVIERLDEASLNTDDFGKQKQFLELADEIRSECAILMDNVQVMEEQMANLFSA